MTFVWLRWRADTQSQWRVLAILALVVGFGGGITLTAFAGARRADTAMGRFVAYSLPDTGGFLFGSLFSPPVAPGAPTGSLVPPPLMKRVVSLPQVTAYFREPSVFVTTDPRRPDAGIGVVGVPDADLMSTVDRPMVVAGQLPGSRQTFAASVDELAAQEAHLHVGSHVRVYAYAFDQLASGVTGSHVIGSQLPAGPTYTLTVTAIVRFAQDVNAVRPLEASQGVPYVSEGNLYVTSSFLVRLASGLGIPVQRLPGMNLVGVRLRHGAPDWAGFASQAKAIGGNQIFLPAPTNVQGVFTAAGSAQRGIRLEVVALTAFGGLAEVVTLLLVGQALARRAMQDGDDFAILRTLGASRGQITALVLLRAAAVGLGGGVLAFVGAALASGLMPVGLARQAEVHLGVEVDWVVLLPGLLAIAGLLVVASVHPAWRVARQTVPYVQDDQVGTRSPRLADALSRVSARPSLSIGVRFGLERGRGRSAIPVATGVFGAVVAVAALAGSLTFDHSLGNLVNSPRQQGWNWDVLVGNPNDFTNDEALLAARLASNPLVASYSAIAIVAGDQQGTAVIDGKVIDTVLAFDALKGSVYPPLLRGRAPRAADEVVLGEGTLQALHKHIGQSVRIAGAPVPKFRVVGTMIVPSVGDMFTNDMGEGAWIYGPALMDDLKKAAPASASEVPPTVFNLFAVRYAAGSSPGAAFSSLQRQFAGDVLRAVPSENVVNLQSVDLLPLVLAGLVVVVGITTVGNTLVVSVRQRRREFAVLKTIGFERRQVAVAVACQATCFGIMALLAGLPLGIIAGRWAWALVASDLGSVSPALVPVVAVVAVVPATLAICVAIAAVPGWSAARVAPAITMRKE